MRQFFKFVFATVTGIFLFLIIIVVLLSVLSGKKEEISDNTVLRLDLNKRIVERQTDNLFAFIGSPFGDSEGATGLLELRRAIARAKADNKIKGILLRTYDVHIGAATLEELRNQLIDFKESGKFLVAYSDSYNEAGYYLSSIADQIFLPEQGLLEFDGLSAELMFFKKTLEKLELKPEIFKVGEFKSAVEPLIREDMSEENKLQMSSLLNSFHNHFLINIAAARGVNVSSLKNLSDSLLIQTAEDALTNKLITDVGYFSNVEDFLRARLNLPEKEKINYVGYSSLINGKYDSDRKEGKNRIAVIFANGSIEQGEGRVSSIGSETFSKEIRKAREDDDVKAIVLRINSPGGSALASDIIWNEVAKCEKPIIASMGDVAASGGYYIAMACDTIIANPTTVTGSIGVFGVYLQTKDFLNNKLGITVDRVKTSPYADLGSVTREMTTYERQVIQKQVDRIYEVFVNKAAEGRKISADEIKTVAEGRVWSGNQAKEIKLTDINGGLEDAIKLAASKAGIEDNFTTVYLPDIKIPFLRQMLLDMGSEDESVFLQKEFGQFYPYIRSLKEVEKLEGVQALMPYQLIFK
ncbi:MAG: signal peptide peptidase SppA [Cytophagaceae bacterium]